MKTLRAMGVFAFLLLIVFGFECAITSGTAAEFEKYTAAGWLFQCLMVVCCAWWAAEIVNESPS